VDSSVWVRFFRQPEPTLAEALSQLVRKNRAQITQVIRAELLSGTRHEADYRLLEERLSGVVCLPEPDDLWDRVARARFLLARKGVQASLMDLSIGVHAQIYHSSLWTLDFDFRFIQKVIPLKFFLPKA
jgi:predicted nucleic acid-binding protein